MSDYTDFVASLREWANREDWSDGRVAEFIRLGEAELNRILRVRQMVTQVTVSPAYDGSSEVPDDWLGSIFVQVDGESLRYAAPDEFSDLGTKTAGRYTMLGSTLTLGGITGNNVCRLTYWARIPAFTSSPGTNTWVQSFYYHPFLWATLVYAGAFGLEDDRVARIKADLYDTVNALNAADDYARTSGSVLARRRKRTLG